MKCEYVGEKIKIEGETSTEPSCPDCHCNNEATHVLRLITIPESKIQTPLLYQRKCICKKHAIYLCNDAPFKWENLHHTVEEELERREELGLITSQEKEKENDNK